MELVRSSLLAAFVVGSAVSSSVFAGCLGSVVNGRCIGSYTDNRHVGQAAQDTNSPGYSSSTGTQYQYNLTNPVDRNQYSTDLDAQRRDRMNVDPRGYQDRAAGSAGAGIGGCQTWPCK